MGNQITSVYFVLICMTLMVTVGFWLVFLFYFVVMTTPWTDVQYGTWWLPKRPPGKASGISK